MTLIRWIRDAWLIVGATLLLLLLADGLLKAVLPEQGWPQVREGAEAPARASADALEGEAWVPAYFRELKAARHMRWEPYSYWRRRPFDGEWIRIDEAGQRQTWQAPAEPIGELWIFGGSAVWGTGARDEHTLPSELARVLQRRGLPLRVVNFGESGYVSTQNLVTLQRALQQRAPPDAVIFYDGVNDVFAALQSGRAGIPQNEWERASDFRSTNGLDNWLAAFPRVLEGLQRLGSPAAPPSDLQSLAAEVLRAYRQNVLALQALGRSHDFETLAIWQPSIFSRTTLSNSEQAVLESSLVAHRDLQLAVNDLLEKARLVTPRLADLSSALDELEQPVYLDFCHLSEAGNRHMAGLIADQLEETGVLAALASAAER